MEAGGSKYKHIPCLNDSDGWVECNGKLDSGLAEEATHCLCNYLQFTWTTVLVVANQVPGCSQWSQDLADIQRIGRITDIGRSKAI